MEEKEKKVEETCSCKEEACCKETSACEKDCACDEIGRASCRERVYVLV